jgi:hypothetical protein
MISTKIPHVRITKVDHKLMRLSMIQPKLPLSVCTKECHLEDKGSEKQVHNYKLEGQGSLEHIMQRGSLKDKR